MDDLIACILRKDMKRFHELLPKSDTNQTRAAITPLWCAIMGVPSKPKEPTNRGNSDIVEKLLSHNADPNKKTWLLTPTYQAVYERQLDILVLLLLHGADPNIHSICRCQRYENTGQETIFCRMPIALAVEHADVDAVTVLIKGGAHYNKVLIDKAKRDVAKYKKLIINGSCFKKKMRDMQKILYLLEENYQESFETKCIQYWQNNMKTGLIPNYFIHMQDASDVEVSET